MKNSARLVWLMMALANTVLSYGPRRVLSIIRLNAVCVAHLNSSVRHCIGDGQIRSSAYQNNP